MSLKGRNIRGVLLDITGVLAESSVGGDGTAIVGSVEAVKRLKSAGIAVRFVTNETQRTRESLVGKLHRLGFDMPEEEIFPPALAMAAIIKQKGLRPHLLVHENCLPDLGVASCIDGSANCVVLGDATDSFTYPSMNAAFRTLIRGGADCAFYSLGKGKYYKEDGELTLDVGPYAAALEFATGRSATVVGKPSGEFFHTALQDMGVAADEAVMVGDDIVSDVGGAQAAGLLGVLVRTGKYTPGDENHPVVKPDRIVDNLAKIVDEILETAK